MSEQTPDGLTYSRAGVDRGRARSAIAEIERLWPETDRPGVLSGLGGFAGAFDIGALGYRHPVLLAGADGVGTKLMIAVAVGKHDTVGIDLVAMCANDVLAQGGEPLFFLDYIGMGRIDPIRVRELATGIASGCAMAGCALLGGETAELPGMYDEDCYELAGFCVGIVERERLLDGSAVRAGDRIIGLPSSGLHSNGFSLVRRIIDEAGLDLTQPAGENGHTLGEELLEPTRIYVRPVRKLLEAVEVHALAHITGGGLIENVPRVLPDGLLARITRGSWTEPPIFDFLSRHGKVQTMSMFQTFNMGLGMIAIIPSGSTGEALTCLAAEGLQGVCVGEVVAGDQRIVII